jgi:putative SOS response-associated peptidase YedK
MASRLSVFARCSEGAASGTSREAALLHPHGRRTFFIGGMWDVWHAEEEDRLNTFTVLTTFPNAVSATVHDRMPVIVQAKDYQRWLDRRTRTLRTS